MKATLVLYSANRQITKNHFPVLVNGEVACWVRAEAFPPEADIREALVDASPKAGETVLNSIEIP